MLLGHAQVILMEVIPVVVTQVCERLSLNLVIEVRLTVLEVVPPHLVLRAAKSDCLDGVVSFLRSSAQFKSDCFLALFKGQYFSTALQSRDYTVKPRVKSSKQGMCSQTIGYECFLDVKLVSELKPSQCTAHLYQSVPIFQIWLKIRPSAFPSPSICLASICPETHQQK
jgi:hypothetical protein